MMTVTVNPAISVLMPVFNSEKYLEQSINSILNQTFRDFEFILINDGSTDRSAEILADFQSKDDRICLISHENRGLIAVLNEGIAHATGEFIARMDADDIACPERFSQQIAFLQQHPDYVAVGSQVQLIDADGDKICSFTDLGQYGQSDFTDHEAIDQAHLEGRGGTICHPAVMLRRDALLKIGGYSTHVKHAEDLDLFLRLGEIGRLANLVDTLMLYRMHPNSIGHLKRKEQKESARVAVLEAFRRRRLPEPEVIATGGEHQDTLSELHQKWVWWALKGGNIHTARKHARIAVQHSPLSVDAWKTLWCSVRGY